jgi:hypothetical protein
VCFALIPNLSSPNTHDNPKSIILIDLKSFDKNKKFSGFRSLFIEYLIKLKNVIITGDIFYFCDSNVELSSLA